MQRLEVDDTSSLIGYSGSWLALQGSSRQWQSTIHSTTTPGATAAINFQGTRVVIYCTIPIGSGTNVLASVNLDGRTTTFSHSTNSSAIYGLMLFDSGPISDTPHSIVLTNDGSSSTSPLQLDRFHLEGTVFNVSPGGPPQVVGSTSTAGGPPITTSQPPVVSSTDPDGGSPTSTISGPPSINFSSLPSASSTGDVFMTITDSNGGYEVVPLPQNFKATTVAIANAVTGIFQSTEAARLSVSSYLVTTTRPDGSVATEVVDTPVTQSTSESAHITRGALIGCVTGGAMIVFIVLIAGLIFRSRRKRRFENGLVRLADERTPESTAVTPFDLSRRSAEHSANGSLPGVTQYFGFRRNEKSTSMCTSSTEAYANIEGTASTPNLIQRNLPLSNISHLPRLNVDYGHERPGYAIVPYQYASPASASTGTSPLGIGGDTPTSSVGSAVFLLQFSGSTDELPPSYQITG